MQIRTLLTPYRLATAAILLAAVGVSFAGIFWMLSSPVAATATPRSFTVQPGWGGGRIADELQQAGLIRSPYVMIILTNWTKTGDSLKAGTYLLSADMSTRHIIDVLTSGDALSSDISVTVPEGMNVWEVDELLYEQRLILQGSFARSYYEHEGKLFPDTYRFAAEVASGSDEYGNAAVFADAFGDGYRSKASQYTDEQVIIASMLEKEAKSADDMALVAGIIERRMKLGMPLQLDATVAYGWCLARWLPMSSNRNCDVTQAPIAAEIKVDGPYNTYTRKGLPAGPISNPGLKALNATRNPKASDYLYYLSTRDGSQIVYARTLAEHLKNRSTHLGL